MARPYSVDLRRRVVRSVEGGASRRATAAIRGQYQLRGQAGAALAAARHGPAGSTGRRPALAARRPRRAAGGAPAAEPDLTIAELRRQLSAEGIATSRSALGRLLIACGLTRKKTYGTRPSRTARTSPRPGALGASGSRS